MICPNHRFWLLSYGFCVGVQEMEHAARLLLEGGYEPDLIYTSRLRRAIHSTWVLQRELSSQYLPVYHSWRLNERHYGALQGLSKKDTALRLGGNVVQAWWVIHYNDRLASSIVVRHTVHTAQIVNNWPWLLVLHFSYGMSFESKGEDL